MDKKFCENELVLNIIIVIFSIIIIVGLAFLFYYYAIKNDSIADLKWMASNNIENNTASISSATKQNTKVIYFKVPESLPEDIKLGNCQMSSVAQPYREDAFRCIVDNSIYDPCFTLGVDGFVFCQMNPLADESFLIELEEENLPEFNVFAEKKDNWAWFVELENGYFCSPFTGTRPIVSVGEVYYGCNSGANGQPTVLIGELNKGNIWTAIMATLNQKKETWEIKTIESVNISRVWQ